VKETTARQVSEERDEHTVSADRYPEQGRGGASSLTKMLSVLDLFTPTEPVRATNDIIETLEASRSTGYRYIKALTAAGLLSAVGNGYYVLGPRIIELDLQIRNTDPLLQAARGVLEQLVNATGHSALLCMLFRNSVLCIREHLAPLSPEILFSRGQSRPLFQGAISKVILANLPNHRLRSIYSRSQATISETGLGNSWDKFRNNLAKIRKDGHAMSFSEYHPGIVGAAAPVFNTDHNVIGSLGIGWSEEESRDVDINRAVISVKRAAREVTQRMTDSLPGLGLPPRAVG
jgi:DNA-binding IclR family transcriptional regulator